MGDASPLQIAKFNSAGCLMEFMDAFEIGKVKINIAPFDTKTHKQTAIGSFYLNFNEWFSISQRIQSGTMLMEAYNEKVRSEQAKASGQTYYMQNMYVQYGGTPAEKLKPEKKRANNAAEARVFKIFPSIKSNDNIMFAIITGDGKAGDKGQIEPVFNINTFKSNGTTVVTQMPINYNELRGYCQLVDIRINAFIIKQTLDGKYVNNYQPDAARQGISNQPMPTQDLNAKPNETVFTDEDLLHTSNSTQGNVVNMNAYQQNMPTPTQQTAYPQGNPYPQQNGAYPQTMPDEYFQQYAANFK